MFKYLYIKKEYLKKFRKNHVVVNKTKEISKYFINVIYFTLRFRNFNPKV